MACDQRQDRLLAQQIGETRIFGMHCDRGIREHGLGASGGDGDEAVGVAGDRVADVPEMAGDLTALDLEIGDCGLKLRVPVDQAAVAVDQALVVERDEHFPHRAGQAFVHGEALAWPVERGAEPAELRCD